MIKNGEYLCSGASNLKLDVGVIIDHFIKFNQKKRGIHGISEYTEMKKD